MATNPATADDTAPPAPPAAGDARRDLAREFLHGRGLEIGALHLRMWLPDDASARYVDRMAVEDLRHHYPELASLDLAPVDVVDDGERLHTIAAESVDFIVANHFLEHCQDPISTISTHLEKLRPGGVLFYAVPDKRYTFDFRRDRTPLQHVIDDHELGAERSRAEHYLQWASLVHEGTGPPGPEQAQAYAHQLEAEDYSIHFHVWTAADLTELLLFIQGSGDDFEIETVRRNGIENIVVLRKHGTTAPLPPRMDAGPARLPQPVSTPDEIVRDNTGRIPLAALRGRPAPADAEVHWSIDPDGVSGRGLVQPASTRYELPLTLTHEVQVTGQVRLLPHDWRDGSRAVRAAVRASGPDGERELWAGAVASARAGGEMDGVTLTCSVPATTTRLDLVIDPPRIRDPGSAARAVWLKLTMTDLRARRPGGVEQASKSPPARPERPADTLLFSILMPVHDPPLQMLREAVESVLAQSLGNWELCLCDDGSRDPDVQSELRRFAEHPRVHLQRNETAGGISAATNAALQMARGDYIALLDHDDQIVPNALELVADRLADDPTLDMVYSDEAVVADGRRVQQVLKPGWSPESFACHMYACHLGVYRRTIAEAVGGFRSKFDGCQDYDFVLRFTEHTDRVAHIPAQLYHWRAHTASTAGGGEAKPHAYALQPRAIAEHLARTGVDAEVRFGAAPGIHRVAHRVDAGLGVSVAVLARRPEAVLALARSMCEQTHAKWELTVGITAGADHGLSAALEALPVGVERIRIITIDPGLDAVRALNHVVRSGRGEVVVVAGRPAVGLAPDWLAALLGYAQRPAIAAAGALVLDADHRVLDGGWAFPDGMPLAILGGRSGEGASSVTLNVAAAGTVVATRRVLYDELGGLNARYGELALVEYCLRAGERGLRTVCVADARMQMSDDDVPPNDLAAIAAIRSWWTGRPADPLYNPNLRRDMADFSPLVRL